MPNQCGAIPNYSSIGVPGLYDNSSSIHSTIGFDNDIDFYPDYKSNIGMSYFLGEVYPNGEETGEILEEFNNLHHGDTKSAVNTPQDFDEYSRVASTGTPHHHNTYYTKINWHIHDFYNPDDPTFDIYDYYFGAGEIPVYRN